MLNEIGMEETKASIDSKISRGSFSAAFLLQCLSVIGCNKIEIENYDYQLLMVTEPGNLIKKFEMENNTVKFIELFAGLGGIRLGFEKAFKDLN